MGSRKTNAKGRQLQDLLEEGYLYCIEDDSSTYERNDYEEKIDWIIASQPLLTFISNVETHPTIGSTSGHKPLTLEISIGVEHKPTSPRTSFSFKAANWSKFRKIPNDQLQLWNQSRTINTTMKIEEYNMFITNSLLVATQAAIPKLKQATSSYIISEATRSLIKTKHQHYRRWRKDGQETDKQLYYKYKLLLTNSLRNDRKDHYKTLMSSLCQKKMFSESVWLTVRKFHQKRIKQSFPRIMKYNNIVATSEKEKANVFAEFFQSEIYAAPNNTLPFHDQVSNQVNVIRNRMQNTDDIKWKKITPEEVKWHMKQLRNSATGPDNIHNRCLKNYTSQLIDHLTLLFNSIVDVGYIAIMWKKANIILLLKPNKGKQQPSSYRPISLLSCLGKLLERIIKQRLLLELNARNILPQHQAGFRPKRSTMYNIVRIERYIKSQLHHPMKRRHAAASFFGIEAAFDSVWHEGLIYKFNDLRLPTYIIKYLISFLENRTATVELDNTLSRLFTLSSGTPQCSPLSPLLYIIYTSDLMNGIPPHTEHGLFADDTALWTSSHQLANLNNRLQQSINEFEKCCKAWKLKLQPIKTELVHFSIHPRKKYKNPVQVKVEDIIIQPATSTRYLGVIIDNRLSWRTHQKQVETRIAARLSLLRFLNRAAIEPNHNIMINLYKSLIRTVITYDYPVLLSADNKIWDRIQIVQNKALRVALGLPHYTSVDSIH
ncbi:unnamed protein product [Rotaria socialis]|uniref:Reverse transcriptase domain-containing protein n=1 Tax=Rotaria socialis TaxID=392032 RepID=A0A820U2L8_9BILA|nr:unnamed protein product [Rotaria socialis]CAF4476154.1 unnamed protein product [Rotaria socialis]